MSSRPWMPMFWADYFGDTKHLTTIQHGAYLQLIGHYWLHGKLPDDDRALANIVGMRVDTWRRWHREAIRHFFEDGWRHKRIEDELAKASAFSGIQRDRINKRWGGQDTAGNTRARATPQPHSQTGGNDVRENRSLVAAARRAQEAAQRQLAEHRARENGVDHDPGPSVLRVVPQG